MKQFLRLDWRYAVGQFLVIVFGVLVALAVDSWHDSNVARAEERRALDQLISDVQRDTALFNFWSRNIDTKEASLQRLVPALLNPDFTISDSLGFLRDVARGSDYGWAQPPVNKKTFDALSGSGGLGVILDDGILQKVVGYYSLNDEVRARIEPRRTEYPGVAYGLFPRSREYQPEDGLSGRGVRDAVLQVRTSELGQHVIAEINYARFVNYMIQDLGAGADSLLVDLRAYRLSR